MLHEFYRVQLALPSRPLSQTQTQVHWQPPPNSILKGNFDGATFKDVNMVGLGVVVHDSQGQVLASLSNNIRLPPPPPGAHKWCRSFGSCQSYPLCLWLWFFFYYSQAGFRSCYQSSTKRQWLLCFLWSPTLFFKEYYRCLWFYFFISYS